MFNLIDSAGVANMSFNEYYSSVVDNIAKITDDPTPLRDKIMNTLKANSAGKSKSDVEQEIKNIAKSFPSVNDAKRIFMVNWIGSTKDIDHYMPERLQIENDLLKGKRAGYIYIRAFTINLSNYKIQNGPYFDDIDKPEGTNEVIQDIYGKETSIFNLPFEVQLNIDNNTFVLKEQIGSGQCGLDRDPKYTVILGSEKKFLNFLNSKYVPKVKDLKID
jgi:hypothetical protein